MARFDAAVIAAAHGEREAQLTTFGRHSGDPARIILWFYTDDAGERIFVRSGGGLGRDWPRNLLANGRGILHAAGQDVPVRARHVTDSAEARRIGGYARAKYGGDVQVSSGDEQPTPGETATFELIPE